MQDVTVIFRRRGGDDLVQSHTQWEKTVQYSPDVIEMSFFPITLLLEEIFGKDHLTRAINLYLECKTSQLLVLDTNLNNQISSPIDVS